MRLEIHAAETAAQFAPHALARLHIQAGLLTEFYALFVALATKTSAARHRGCTLGTNRIRSSVTISPNLRE